VAVGQTHTQLGCHTRRGGRSFAGPLRLCPLGGFGILVRAGSGSWTSTSFFSDAETSFTTVPLTIAGVRGERHRLEFGGGVTLGRETRELFAGRPNTFVSLTGLVGYRYEKPGRGLLFRGGFTPFYGFGEEDVAYPEKGFFPSFGLSLGYSF
jgi:hypothetical protein